MLYTVTDYNAGEYGTDLLQKLAFCRSDAQIQKIHNALADYPEELIVYRGEAEGSTNYRKAISWSLDINTAFFFACRHGDQNHARIIRAKIRRNCKEVWDCRRRMQDDQRKERDYLARE